MVYEDKEKSYASSGVGTAALTTGIIGTTLASGILNNGLGGIFGGNQNPTASASYQLSQKDTRIAQLEAEKYADGKFFALSEKVASIEGRVATIEKTEPLRDQILGERIANLQNMLYGICKPMVPNYALAPGYGPAVVAPFIPSLQPTVQNGSVATSANATGNA
jgi:hypothetical protein